MARTPVLGVNLYITPDISGQYSTRNYQVLTAIFYNSFDVHENSQFCMDVLRYSGTCKRTAKI